MTDRRDFDRRDFDLVESNQSGADQPDPARSRTRRAGERLALALTRLDVGAEIRQLHPGGAAAEESSTGEVVVRLASADAADRLAALLERMAGGHLVSDWGPLWDHFE